MIKLRFYQNTILKTFLNQHDANFNQLLEKLFILVYLALKLLLGVLVWIMLCLLK